MLDKAKKEMRENFKRREFSRQDNTNLTLVYEDEVYHTPNKACHAGLSRRKRGCVYALSAVQKRGCTRKAETAYLKWLMNDSKLSEMFLTSLIGDVRRNGIVVDGHKPSNLVAIALIATRIPNEWGQRCELWYELHKAGCNGDLALFLIHDFNFGRGGRVSQVSESYHLPLPYLPTTGQLASYLTGQGRRDTTYYEKGSYQGLDGTWGRGGEDLVDWVGRLGVKDEEALNLNVFKKEKKLYDCGVDVWCKTVAKAGEALLEEIL